MRKTTVLHNNVVWLMGLKNIPVGIQILNATLFKTFDLLQLNDIYNLELGKFMHKVHHNTLPKSLNSMFVRIDSVHRYPTSSSRNREFYHHRTNTAAYQKWISTAGITQWEKIEPSLKNESYNTFAQKYRKSIIESY